MDTIVTITTPAFTKSPNANGRIYSEEVIKKAIQDFQVMPIIDRSCANNIGEPYGIPKIVGMVDKVKFKKRKDVIEFKGRLMNATLSCMIDNENNSMTFTDMSLLPFGNQGE